MVLTLTKCAQLSVSLVAVATIWWCWARGGEQPPPAPASLEAADIVQDPNTNASNLKHKVIDCLKCV